MSAEGSRGLSLRRAGAGDADLLAGLHASAFTGADVWDAAAMARLLALPGVSALIAVMSADNRCAEGAPAGFIMLRSAADEAEIVTFCVAPAQQRRGVGRRLLDAAMGLAAKAGARRLYLEVAADNCRAARLYEAAGFVECGRREGYYPREDGRATDARILARSLLQRMPANRAHEI